MLDTRKSTRPPTDTPLGLSNRKTSLVDTRYSGYNARQATTQWPSFWHPPDQKAVARPWRRPS